MKRDAVHGGSNDYLLTTSQLLQIKIALTYTRKYRIFTGLENTYISMKFLLELTILPTFHLAYRPLSLGRATNAHYCATWLRTYSEIDS